MKLRSVKKNSFGAVTAVLMSVALFAAAPYAQAAENIGVLDEVKLGDGFTRYRTAIEELNRSAKAAEKQLIAREVLNETEGKRFDELIVKGQRTPGEEAELQALVTTGSDRSRTYNSLIGKAARTPEDEAQMKEMQDYKRANAGVVGRLEDLMFQQLKTQQEATDREYVDRANLVVQKVAGDKKLVAVLRKDAVAWFSPTVDITDEVLRRLNQE